MLMTVRYSLCVWLLCTLAWCQKVTLGWKENVRRCAEANDGTAAMRIVDFDLTRAPRDMDVRAWRARVLLWSGKVAEAEREFKDIIAVVPNDPDNWMGLASV